MWLGDLAMAAAEEKQRTSIWTSANVITCVRIVFIPVFMVLALQVWKGGETPSLVYSLLSFILYAALSLTDKLDGYLARSRHEITDFGKFLDPIADKLLVVAAMLVLMLDGYVNIWYVFIILVREFLVSAMRMVVGAEGVVIAADKLGKWKTATTMLALSGYYLYYVLLALSVTWPADVLLVACDIVMLIAVVLTVVSGAQYLWNYRKYIFKA